MGAVGYRGNRVMLDASHQSAVQRGEPAMIARFLVMLYAILSYGVFLISVVWAIGFVGNIAVPKSIDVGGDTPLAEAVIVDMALLGLFAVQHSTMARASFKRRWVRSFRRPASAAPMCCCRV